MSRTDSQSIIEVCLCAGKIMLQSGGETYRVEDTMTRIAAAYGASASHSYVTPTVILFALDGTEPVTRLCRIADRTTDLGKVALVNGISRRISAGELSVVEALQELEAEGRSSVAYPLWLHIAAAAVASGFFLLMFQGGRGDVLPALFTGGIGFAVYSLLHRRVHIKFFAEFTASLMIGLCTILLARAGLSHSLDLVMISSVMPLVPGLAITNAIRDLMAGHLVSGLSKGAESLITAFAIGAGIACMLTFR